MKLKIIIFLLFVIGQGLFASPRIEQLTFYSGYLNNQVTVGQELSVLLFDNLLLYTGFESYLASYETTYFSPSMIDYKIGLFYDQVGWEHSCLHSLDKTSDNTLPIRDRFYVVW
tara:strand:- start:594 stop:935 length:342 start_codon:yes stop_codon:yes gene_type:complete